MARTDQARIDIKSAEDLMQGLSGARILGGMETEDGLHIHLEGGKVLIFTGTFVIAVYKDDDTVVH
jgi:hypothetical protein